MQPIRPAAELVVDNPHADGLLEKHGFGHDWTFEDPQHDRPGAAEDFVPGWILDGCEIIAPLRAVGLRGYAVKADMSLDGWQVLASDYWKLARPAGRPRAAYMFYYDARPNQYGSVISAAEYEPRICVWLWRFSPPDGQTYPVFVEITLHGDGAGPSYTVQVPLHDETYKYPRLWRHEVGATDPHLVDELQRYDAGELTMRHGVAEQVVWIEETDGVLIVYLTGASEPWVYRPEDGLGPSRGRVSVTIRGHCAMFNLQPIQYPQSGTARPSAFISVPDWMNQTPQYSAVAGGEGTVQIQAEAGEAAGQTRPVIQLSSTQPGRRPVVYLVHQFHDAIFSAGQSAPQSTAGTDALVRLSWRRRFPRGWSFRAVLRDFDAAFNWRGNEKATVKAGWDEADAQVMVGYLSAPRYLRDADEFMGRRLVEVEGRDLIWARLLRRKFMAWHCSPVGFNFAAWMRHVLGRAGVPPALIDVPDDGYVIAEMPQKWQRRFAFGHDVPVVDAIDAVVNSRGWVWGIDESGRIWAGPEPQYSGTPDFVLDETTASEEDLIEMVAAERATEAFRNYVAVFTSRYGVQAAILHDGDSHRNPAAEDFIGDDWWIVEVAPDEVEPAALAQRLFSDHNRMSCQIIWQTPGRPQLKPGQFVEVRVDGLGVAEGTVFQIIEDIGLVDYERGVFRSVFLGRLAE